MVTIPHKYTFESVQMLRQGNWFNSGTKFVLCHYQTDESNWERLEIEKSTGRSELVKSVDGVEVRRDLWTVLDGL